MDKRYLALFYLAECTKNELMVIYDELKLAGASDRLLNFIDQFLKSAP